MLLFELSGPNYYKWLIFHFSLEPILRGTFCNIVAMATAQNVTNWFDLQKVS